MPSSARGRFIELEVAEVDRRLRGQLRNVDAVEAQVRLAMYNCHQQADVLLLCDLETKFFAGRTVVR